MCCSALARRSNSELPRQVEGDFLVTRLQAPRMFREPFQGKADAAGNGPGEQQKDDSRRHRNTEDDALQAGYACQDYGLGLTDDDAPVERRCGDRFADRRDRGQVGVAIAPLDETVRGAVRAG